MLSQLSKHHIEINNDVDWKRKYWKSIKLNYSFKGNKSDLVLDMCIQLGADSYLFGSLGKEYVVKEDFMKKGVVLHYQNYNHPIQIVI